MCHMYAYEYGWLVLNISAPWREVFISFSISVSLFFCNISLFLFFVFCTAIKSLNVSVVFVLCLELKTLKVPGELSIIGL